MHLDPKAEPLPLRLCEDNTIRIGRTRIPIERVVYAFITAMFLKRSSLTSRRLTPCQVKSVLDIHCS